MSGDCYIGDVNYDNTNDDDDDGDNDNGNTDKTLMLKVMEKW